MKFHHIGLAVKSIQDELTFYKAVGATNISNIYNDELQNVKIAFFCLGGIRYELVEPLKPASPVDNFISKGIKIYHTCYEVNNINAAVDSFIAHGAVAVLSPTPACALGNNLVSFVLTSTNDLIEFLEVRDENTN